MPLGFSTRFIDDAWFAWERSSDYLTYAGAATAIVPIGYGVGGWMGSGQVTCFPPVGKGALVQAWAGHGSASLPEGHGIGGSRGLGWVPVPTSHGTINQPLGISSNGKVNNPVGHGVWLNGNVWTGSAEGKIPSSFGTCLVGRLWWANPPSMSMPTPDNAVWSMDLYGQGLTRAPTPAGRGVWKSTNRYSGVILQFSRT